MTVEAPLGVAVLLLMLQSLQGLQATHCGLQWLLPQLLLLLLPQLLLLLLPPLALQALLLLLPMPFLLVLPPTLHNVNCTAITCCCPCQLPNNLSASRWCCQPVAESCLYITHIYIYHT